MTWRSGAEFACVEDSNALPDCKGTEYRVAKTRVTDRDMTCEPTFFHKRFCYERKRTMLRTRSFNLRLVTMLQRIRKESDYKMALFTKTNAMEPLRVILRFTNWRTEEARHKEGLCFYKNEKGSAGGVEHEAMPQQGAKRYSTSRQFF